MSLYYRQNEGKNVVSVELFSKLKEIDSLTKMRNKHLAHKQEQEDRLCLLAKKQADAILRTEKLKHELVKSHDALATAEKELALAIEQKQRLIDLGGEQEKILRFQTKINSLEDHGLRLLGEGEEFEKELEEGKFFLRGLEKTIAEITEEVRLENLSSDRELANIDLRLSLLREELPIDFRNLLEKVSNKKLAHGPFTRVDHGGCFFCRFKISRMDESEIDMQKNLKTCPQCGRIFLPYGS